MSILVRLLLRQKEAIYNKGEIDSDSFMDLISIEMAANTLHEKGAINDEELKIVSLLSDGKTYDDVAEELGVSRTKIIYNFRDVANRIAFYLGYEFTDGYIIDKRGIDEFNSLRKELKGFI